MSFRIQNNRLQALYTWFLTAQGQRVEKAFFNELDSISEFLKGDTLLQLGDFGNNFWLKNFRYSHQLLLSSYFKHSSTVISSFDHLPLDRNRIDCIVAPFSMEIFHARRGFIDEMDRILKPMGYLIFWGINPLSLWGICARLGWGGCFDSISTRPSSVFFVKRAMLSRGYVQCKLSSFYFIPPINREAWLSRLEGFNRFGKLLWPCPAGFYCLIVQKHQENYLSCLSSSLEEELFYT